MDSRRCERIAGDGGHALLITVDCGVTLGGGGRAGARARAWTCWSPTTTGPAPTLPDCPVVHPALGDGPSSPELCAAGVVLKLSAALRAARRAGPAEADEDLDLAGLATVCDMVPLRGENRRIARQGMRRAGRTAPAGAARADGASPASSRARWTRRPWASGWARGSTPRAGCSAPMPRWS